jgi:hypothetical protein
MRKALLMGFVSALAALFIAGCSGGGAEANSQKDLKPANPGDQNAMLKGGGKDDSGVKPATGLSDK